MTSFFSVPLLLCDHLGMLRVTWYMCPHADWGRLQCDWQQYRRSEDSSIPIALVRSMWVEEGRVKRWGRTPQESSVLSVFIMSDAFVAWNFGTGKQNSSKPDPFWRALYCTRRQPPDVHTNVLFRGFFPSKHISSLRSVEGINFLSKRTR